jgi:hypothetical protein
VRNRNLEELTTLKNNMEERMDNLSLVNPILHCSRSEFQGRKDEMRYRNLDELTTIKNDTDNHSLI